MKLHLCAGGKKLQGFISIDVRKEQADIISDMRQLPYDDNSIDEIYICHGIEHLSFKDVDRALREYKRVLVPGGLLRLSLPDFNQLVKVAQKVGLRFARHALMGGQEYAENFHYSVWDKQTLAEALIRAGFSHIHPYNPDNFLPRYFRDWSVGTIAGIPVSLNLVAEA